MVNSAAPSPTLLHLNLCSADTAEDYFASKELVEELQQGFGSKGEVWFFAQSKCER